MITLHIDAITTPYDEKNPERITGEKTIVIIDILRATSTIVAALESGARGIYPTMTVQEAFDKRDELCSSGSCPHDILLGGERGGLKVSGFDLGNSPLEYTSDVIRGKTVVLSTTNGTKAIRRSLHANCVVIGSFLNGTVTAKHVLKEHRDTVFYLSGKQGYFSYEDAAGAGFIIHEILESTPPPRIELTDSASMCLDLFRLHKDNLAELLRNVSHGKYLDFEGFGPDLVYCAEKNISDLVPVVCGTGLIKPLDQ
jgi:2-phosphosulfolactate phosphatase